MPVKPCQIDGRPGRKWGDEGKCYPCKRDGDGWDCSEAEEKAKRQGRAIQARRDPWYRRDTDNSSGSESR